MRDCEYGGIFAGWPGVSPCLPRAIDAAVICNGGIAPDAIHADRGTSMTSKPVAVLLCDLHISQSHSRPHVSNDNPFSEAQFKTLKYCPAFPGQFGSLPDARAFSEVFFTYYNNEHRHSGIGLHTPASVHDGTAAQIQAHRALVLQAAYAANPERFRRPPAPPPLPARVWINQPPPLSYDIEDSSTRVADLRRGICIVNPRPA